MDPSARIGTTLRGKWRLDRVLGTGGFATVYAATDRAGKRVAIKVLHPALNASAEVRQRFLEEAYATNTVDHRASSAWGTLVVEREPAGSITAAQRLCSTKTNNCKLWSGRKDIGHVATWCCRFACLALDIMHRADGERGGPDGIAGRQR